MKLHDSAVEAPFEAKIDARFPYNHRSDCSVLIEEARQISLNAVFCVLDEICRPPSRSAVTKERQLELLAEWSSNFEHDLKEPLLGCANSLIEGQTLPWPDAVAVMEQIGRFEAQRAALSVAYFAGDCDSDEGDAALNYTCREVSDCWDKAGV